MKSAKTNSSDIDTIAKASFWVKEGVLLNPNKKIDLQGSQKL